MDQRLSKKDYYYKVTPKKNKVVLVLWILSIVINVAGIMMGPASILGLIACVVCWIGTQASFSKWWGLALAIWGVIQLGLIYVIGGVVPWAMIILGVYLFQMLNNLDKAYAKYLQTGELPDTAGY